MHAARLRQRLQPRRDVHPVAEQIVPLHHHVALMQADAKLHLASAQSLLHANCATQCLHRARKLREQAVAGRLEDPPAVLRHQRLDHLAPQRPQPRQRARLIGADQARIPNHIGRQDRSEAPGGHRGPIKRPC
jgi:hypothetical protein